MAATWGRRLCAPVCDREEGKPGRVDEEMSGVCGGMGNGSSSRVGSR